LIGSAECCALVFFLLCFIIACLFSLCFVPTRSFVLARPCADAFVRHPLCGRCTLHFCRARLVSVRCDSDAAHECVLRVFAVHHFDRQPTAQEDVLARGSFRTGC